MRSSSQCTFPYLAGPDPYHGTDIRHEDLAVPDTACLRAARNGFDHARGQVIRGEHFDLDLGHEIGRIFSAPIDFPIPLLSSKSFDFRDRHPVHTHFYQCIFDFIQLERLHDGFNHLHVDTSLPGSPENADRTPSRGSRA